MQFDFLNNYSILIVMFFVDIAYTTGNIQQLSQESHTFRQLMLYRPSFLKKFFFWSNLNSIEMLLGNRTRLSI